MMQWQGSLKNQSYRILLRTLAQLERRGKPTLIRNLEQDLKRSKQLLHVQLGKLEDEGFVVVEGGFGQVKQPELTDQGRAVARTLGARVLGEIPAGLLRAVPETDGFDGEGAPLYRESWDDALPPTEEFGTLFVKGDSMIGDCLQTGDEVQIELGVRLGDLEDGEIAAVMVGDEREATLKHVHFDAESRQVTLRASNPKYRDIVAPAAEVRVVGAFYGMVRVNASRDRRNRR